METAGRERGRPRKDIPNKDGDYIPEFCVPEYCQEDNPVNNIKWKKVQKGFKKTLSPRLLIPLLVQIIPFLIKCLMCFINKSDTVKAQRKIKTKLFFMVAAFCILFGVINYISIYISLKTLYNYNAC